MPTQRFFHLKEEKQNIIKKAALEECARVPYSEISINKIIKAADISRGSFYTYFEDKEDMIKYLLDDFRNLCMNYICQEIEKADGDTIMATEKMALEAMERSQNHANSQVYRNLLFNVSTITNIKTFGPGQGLYGRPEYREFVKRCYEKNNQEKCHFKDEEQMACVIDMLFTLMMKHLAESHMLELVDRETIRKNMHEQLEIIRHGL